MATSGSFQKAVTSWLNLRVEWVANSQSTATNKTNLTATAYLVSTASNGVINSAASKTVSLTINGTTYSYSAAGLAKISGNQKKKLFSKTVDVAHNANGTKSCSISCSLGIQVTLGGTYYGTISTSGTAELNTIPRASSISSISGNTIGSSVTVNISPASSSFTHKLYYTAPTQTSLVAISSMAAGVKSASFTPSINDCSYIPKATSGTAKITLETYSGSTKIGTATKTFTLNVPSSVVPSISALTVAEAVEGIAAKFGVYVQNKSKASVSITAAGVQGSTINSYSTKLTIGSTTLTYNGASFTSDIISNAGTVTITATVTDSRGRTATESATITVAAYFPPEVNDLTVQRWNKTENKADDEGKYLHYSVNTRISPVNNKNDRQIKFEYKLANASDWTTLTDWADIGAYNLEDVGTYSNPTFSTDNAYQIRVSVKDYFSTATKTAKLQTARTIFDILADGTGICFGGVANLPNTAEFAMKTKKTNGEINIIAEKVSDLNELTQPNIYVSVNNSAETYANLPTGLSGTFTIEVMSAGAEGQLMQRITACSKTDPDIYIRHYYQGAWGEWIRQFEVQLYNNASGSTGTITLNESVENFEYIEIFYTDNNNKVGGSVKVYSPQGKTASLCVVEAGSAVTTYFRRTSYTISGTTITPDTATMGYVKISNATASHTSGTNYIKITRVVGFERGFM